jgi:ATP-dependent protease ClpP protease subunit
MNLPYKKDLINKTRSNYRESQAPEYNVNYIPHRSGTYRIEIDAGIEDVSQFSTAIQVLGMAKEDDEVEIHLQSPGGNVDACGAFLHALRKCRAPIHMVASGGVHSAGTHILLEADSFELAEGFNSLIHNGSSGSYGNINEYHAKSDFDKVFIYNHYQTIYEGFLSDEEFKGMMRGDNIWLNAKQWHDRALKRSEYYQAKFEEASKPVRKPRKTQKKPVDSTTEA